jgi:thiamine pyrophosphokinase
MKKENIKGAVVIANGEIKDYARIGKIIMSFHRHSPLVISADGGIENTTRLGLMPHVVIGDMDSIDRQKYAGILSRTRFVSVPGNKDESDTRLAVEYALKEGIADITIAGATGKRIDHTFANILILASPELKGASVRIVTEESEIFCMTGPGIIKGSPGKLVSIFSLTPYTSFLRTAGLRYPLKDEKLYQSPVRGLSNIFTSDEARLEFSEGKLLIIRQL